MTEETKNTFAELEEKAAGNSEVKPAFEGVKLQEPTKETGEINIQDFSDVAVGERVKYVRPGLDGAKDVIDKFQVFSPDITQEPRTSQSGASKYWPVTMILHYGTNNAEGVQNREYISGARSFVNRDGGASDISFWYEGSETQSAYLWELVADKLDIEPKELSPRQFIAFLNSKPNIEIVGKEYENFGRKPGEPKTITKNMPGEFLA